VVDRLADDLGTTPYRGLARTRITAVVGRERSALRDLAEHDLESLLAAASL
jgi:hypothetical protein